MVSKKEDYEALVKLRKNHRFPKGLENPSKVNGGEYDNETQIGPWSKWQGNLDAKIMVIGQDWGDINTYIKNKGSDKDIDTNKRLRELFLELGIELGPPENPNKTDLFLTNAVLGLKQGKSTDSIKSSWITDGKDFLERTISIVKPKIIIALGTVAYEALTKIYPSMLKKEISLNTLIDSNPIKLPDGILLFVMYHLSPQSEHYNKIDKELQKKDWRKIKEYL